MSTRIKPYARNQTKLVNVTEVVIQNGRRSSKVGPGNPQWCAVNHTVPGIVFSLGMYVGNYYHEFSDVLLPLFLTSRQYDGEVRFLVTDTKSWFINKYRPMLNLMTNHDILDIDNDDRVHCFSHVIVGLYRHAEFGIIDSMVSPQSSYSMVDFGKLIRLAFSLKRETVITTPKSKQKPRLLIVSRTGTRKFLNLQEMIKVSENLGYAVTTSESPESLFEIAKLVNSFDVMLGVHGAGLTSMAFLPMNATVVQIVPWGGIESLARYCFKSATLEFGLRYREYIVGKNESSITEKFTEDDPVLKDPMSVHRQGFSVIRRTYLTQDIRIDVHKISVLLLDIFKTYQN